MPDDLTPEALAVYRCPLCDWVHTPEALQYAASNVAAAPAVAAALGMPADALLSIHRQQAMGRDEHAIERHMRTHPPQDWLPALIEARATVRRLENPDGWDGTFDDLRQQRDEAVAMVERVREKARGLHRANCGDEFTGGYCLGCDLLDTLEDGP